MSSTPDVEQPWRSAELMESLYHGKELTIEDIAERWECAPSTISRWLSRHEIKTRRRGPGTPEKLTDPEWLRERYVVEKQNGVEIAEELGCDRNAVYRWLKKHGIPTRQAGKIPHYPKLTDGEWLEEKYVEEGRGVERVASLVGCSPKLVRKWLTRHGIDTRPQPAVFNNELDGEPAGYNFGPNWDEKRAQALDRDEYECQVCGIGDEEHRETHGDGSGLCVHHITPRVEYIVAGELDYVKANRLQNLITVCLRCHGAVEGMGEVETRDLIEGDT